MSGRRERGEARQTLSVCVSRGWARIRRSSAAGADQGRLSQRTSYTTDSTYDSSQVFALQTEQLTQQRAADQPCRWRRRRPSHLGLVALQFRSGLLSLPVQLLLEAVDLGPVRTGRNYQLSSPATMTNCSSPRPASYTGCPKSFETSNISRFLSFPLPWIKLDRFHCRKQVGQYAPGPRRSLHRLGPFRERPRAASSRTFFNRKIDVPIQCHTDRGESHA